MANDETLSLPNILRTAKPLDMKTFWVITIFFVSCSAFATCRDPPSKHNTMKSSSQLGAIRVGFIGCGTIAVAIVTGIATQKEIEVETIVVSKRSEQKSMLLAETYPDLVTIHEDNQEILDKADLIFLCVLPELTSSILKELSFDNTRHTLVSLVVSRICILVCSN
jgi:ornithine cyclodeaminase/alanine dehydrogenase-like protein (mu-crystallin family)